jgi:DnaK suppressor protein
MAKPLNARELKKFRVLLEEKRRAVLDRARKTLTEDMTLDPNDLPDEMDLAASEYLQSFEFRLRGREKTHLAKLELALRKMDVGTFGICEECEEPIGKKRLEARPETKLCIRCKEDQERDEKAFG